MSKVTLSGSIIRAANGLVLLASLASAQNPDDISFTLRLSKVPAQYEVAESIDFTISLSSPMFGEYRVDMRPLDPRLPVDFKLTPKEGTFDFFGGVTGYSLGGAVWPGLDITPVTSIEHGDLTNWYRFEKAGHYRVSVAIQISEITVPNGATKPLRIESNTVEFDILPHAPEWEARELKIILDAVDAAKDQRSHLNAIHRLKLLDTSAAVREEVRRYLSSGLDDEEDYYWVLAVSSRFDVAIPLLEAGLNDRAHEMPEDIVGLLATLQARRQFGNLPRFLLTAWNDEMRVITQKRWEQQGAIQERYCQQIVDSMPLRTGRNRIRAQYVAWTWSKLHPYSNELMKAEKDLTPRERAVFLNASQQQSH